ncbi:MAG: hypothetical protein EA423_10915 [Phycisphaerales bacterium]|nr:MAG: hypothetical protein EA423_10915 [Phycisphaerales bacterium]
MKSTYIYRVYLTAGLLALAVLLAIPGFLMGEVGWAEFAADLASEVAGIALIVLIVDWMLERNKLREEAQRIAWSMLHDIDHAVWVWQGGRREFHLDELIALLDMVEDKDSIPPFTQNLLANLGVRASDTLRLQSRIFGIHKRLKQAMVYLKSLGQMREMEDLMPPSFVVDALKSSITQLAAVTGQGLHPGEFGVARTFRDASPEAQRARYMGIEQDPFMEGTRWPVAGVARRPRSADPRPPVRGAAPDEVPAADRKTPRRGKDRPEQGDGNPDAGGTDESGPGGSGRRED